MTNQPMYREEALKHRKNIWRGRALIARGIPTWAILLFTLFILSVITLILCAGSYTRRITVSGELVSTPRAVKVSAPAQGFIVNRFIHSGDSVKRGQQLYIIDVSRSTRTGVISHQQRRNTQSQIDSVNSIILRLRENQQTTLTSLEAQKSSFEGSLKISAEMLQKADEGLKEMKFNMESYRRFQGQGLITRDQLAQQSALYYQQQSNLLMLTGQQEQSKLQLLALEADIRTRTTEFDNEILRMEMQKNELVRQLTEDDAASELVITSPVDGRVDSATMTSGQATNVGDVMAQIIPGGTPKWELVVWIPDNAVPFVHVGEPVSIRYNAFPSEKFGKFPGRIAEISVAPTSYQERNSVSVIPPADASSQTWYRMTITPDVLHFVWQGRQLNPGNGLRADCTLFLEKRNLLQWILAPLYDIADSTRGPISGH